MVYVPKRKKIIRTKHRSEIMVIYLRFAFCCAAVCLLFVLLITPDFPVKNQSKHNRYIDFLVSCGTRYT